MAHIKALLFLMVILFASFLVANSALKPVAAQPAADEYVFSHSWGAEGDQIRLPMGIDVDQDGTIYIANNDLNRITKIFKATGISTFVNWGKSGTGKGQFLSPSDVAVDGDGNVYVADTYNDRIQKFSNSGKFERTWGWGVKDGTEVFQICTSKSSTCQAGIRGSGGGQFGSPGGIAVDKDGNVYVADTWNSRIQKFSNSGKFERTWGWGVQDGADVFQTCTFESSECQAGIHGSGAGQFGSPGGIALDRYDNVYVADTSNHRVQKFSQKINNSDGVYEIKHEAQWGGEGSDKEQFQGPGGITARVGADGEVYVYVADTGNNRVQKYSSNGTFVDMWDGSDNDEGQFNDPAGIAVTKAGFVYVADTLNHRVQKLNNDGAFEDQWGGLDRDSGQFDVASGIAVDGDGNVFVTDWSGDGEYSSSLQKHRVQKFSSYGIFEREWGSWGSGQGQFMFMAGIAVDKDGNVYVADGGDFDSVIGAEFLGNNRIQKFYSSGAYQDQWGSEGGGEGQFSGPSDIATATGAGGEVYVYAVEDWNSRIQKFNSGGAYQDQWGSWGNGEGQFRYPDGIAVGADGNVYVADTYNHRIQKFNSSGDFQWTSGWGVQDGTEVFQTCTSACQAGIEGSGQGQFIYPEGIAVGANGNVYVADTENHRIQKLNSSGDYLTQWGSEGNDLGQFKRPSSIAVDRGGNVFVADRGNHRIQVFSATYPVPDPTSGLVLNGSFENSPSLAHWAYRGNLSLADVLVEFEPEDHDYGSYALRLDVSDPLNQDLDQAIAHQTFYVKLEWSHPRLTFRYNMFVNHSVHWSDFFVAIQDGAGLNHKATILRDGYDDPCKPQPPNPLTELGWRSAAYDLSAYKGEHIRLVFASRNLHPGSKGISTFVDDVRVVDVGAEQVYLPVLGGRPSPPPCDPVPGSASNQQSNSVSLLQPAASDALQKRE